MTRPMKTKQEIFNQVVNHLRAQGCAAKSDDGYCKYRTSDGLKCAAGCLIDDEHYDIRFENKRVTDPAVNKALQNSGINMQDQSIHYLVSELQDIHDGIGSANWEFHFANFASENNLVLPVKP